MRRLPLVTKRGHDSPPRRVNLSEGFGLWCRSERKAMTCEACSWRAIPHRFIPDRWIVYRHIGGNVGFVLENDAGNEKLFRSLSAAQRAADSENLSLAKAA